MPQAKRGPLLSLIPLRAPSEAAAAAELAVLTPWVMAFRRSHIEEWPAAGTGAKGPAGSYSRRYPWPECWQEHVALVSELSVFKSWTEVLEMGDLETAAAYGGGYDEWIRHLRDVTAPMVQVIGRVCMAAGTVSHVDMSVPSRGREDWRRPPVGAPSHHFPTRQRAPLSGRDLDN